MKKLIIISFGLAVFMLAFYSTTYGQRGKRGWGHNKDHVRLYNPETVVTLTGTVVQILKVKPAKGISYGIHLIVKTDDETIEAHLGPAWYIENQEKMIIVNDQVEITGSKINYKDKPAIIVSKMQRGEDHLQLRDANGFPAWSGWRKGTRMSGRRSN